MPDATVQLDAQQVEAMLQSLCQDVLDQTGQEESLVLIGIRTRGLPLAERFRQVLESRLGKPVPVGVLDITLYRDDLVELAGMPIVRPTEIPFSLKERTVLLVDDVIYTGRTIRSALDALLDYGRPTKVRLVTLVDRGGRELPIQPDHNGLRIEVPKTHRISVRLKEVDGEDAVLLESLS